MRLSALRFSTNNDKSVNENSLFILKIQLFKEKSEKSKKNPFANLNKFL